MKKLFVPIVIITLFCTCLGTLLHTRVPLFEKYPAMAEKVPHIKLGYLPTPIIKLDKLGKFFDANHLYFKDDGVSGIQFGGNKVRKLEFLLADALDKKAKSIITVGGAGSNHATATVIYAKTLGFDVYSMLSPQLNTSYLRRNLLLSLFYEGTINYYQSARIRNKALKELLDAQWQDGYFIPSGGSCPRGILGFVNAAFELKNQIEQGLLPEPDYIYVALGSAGTAAGLILGLKLAGLQSKVIPVRVSGTSSLSSRTSYLLDRVHKTSKFMHECDATCPELTFLASDMGINNDFRSKQYAQVTPQAATCIQILSDTHGLKLDGTYAGNAFVALLHDLESGHMKNKVLLFWNTFCSGDFSHVIDEVDYKQLPKELHRYFEEPLQDLDQGV